VANQAVNSITVYEADANGNATPMATIFGTSTGLGRPTGVARSSDDRLYVANLSNNTITAYWANSRDDAAPAGARSAPSSGEH
jgi:sugar lactone lactonase YvrE